MIIEQDSQKNIVFILSLNFIPIDNITIENTDKSRALEPPSSLLAPSSTPSEPAQPPVFCT